MGQLVANPYINFQGRAREAMTFYQAAFGGTLDLLAFDEGGAPRPANQNDAIMHSRLAADGVTIMATDGMPTYPPTVGDNMAITVVGSDRERLTTIFTKLSEGGMVKQALKEESWGDTFGYFTDKFGINWMIDITKEDR